MWFVLPLVLIVRSSAAGDPLWCELCSCEGNVVNCAGAELKTVPSVNASDPTNFTAIYLNDNAITRVRAFPDHKLNVTVMSFKNNAIDEIDDAAFRFVGGLREIDLSNNYLSSHSLRGDAFRGSYVASGGFLPLEVEVLRLSGNGLHTLDPDLFEHLPKLRELSLDNNPLGMIDHPTLIALANIPWLEFLDLSKTRISQIPHGMLHTSHHLHVLNISFNSFDDIPSEIESTHELQILVVSGNPIEKVLTSPYVPSLKRLELSSMPKLRKIGSRSLGNFTNLKELVIVNNTHLFEIADDALVYEDENQMRAWPQITKLNISYNKLAWLDAEFIANWDKIEEFGFQANPWVCDCQNDWFLYELIPAIHKIQPEEAAKMMCQDPIEMRGKSMLELSRTGEKLRCLDKYGHQPENDAKVLIFVFAGMLLCLPILVGGLMYYKRSYWRFPSASFSYQRTGSLETIYHR